MILLLFSRGHHSPLNFLSEVFSFNEMWAESTRRQEVLRDHECLQYKCKLPNPSTFLNVNACEFDRFAFGESKTVRSSVNKALDLQNCMSRNLCHVSMSTECHACHAVYQNKNNKK